MGFLSTIVEGTRQSIARAEYGSGIPAARPRPTTSLNEAIRRDRGRGALLVEYKRISPGQPDPILPERSVAGFVEATRDAPVTAFSCIATEPVFHGSPRDVAELARAVDRPVLFKDFVIDPRQVDVAARTGASAVLLIARLESEGHLATPLASLADAAHRAGLEVVLEFHHRSELSRAAEVAADVYGVNSRNLDSLTIDRPTAMHALREASDRGLRPLLGLSGIDSPHDAKLLWDAGADGLLVGTSVARSENPSRFLRSLTRPLGGSTA